MGDTNNNGNSIFAFARSWGATLGKRALRCNINRADGCVSDDALCPGFNNFMLFSRLGCRVCNQTAINFYSQRCGADDKPTGIV
ncbi:MAG: hypothetical protein ACKVOE_07010 [Rickettsiales bacterium]